MNTHSHHRAVTLNWTGHVSNIPYSHCCYACVLSCVERVQRATTRRFNALFQKANSQLINIFKQLLTDKQHRKTVGRQKRYFPRMNEKRSREKNISLTLAHGVPQCESEWHSAGMGLRRGVRRKLAQLSRSSGSGRSLVGELSAQKMA